MERLVMKYPGPFIAVCVIGLFVVVWLMPGDKPNIFYPALAASTGPCSHDQDR
jgi:hypothetical protein